jgi:peptidyl-prolyl cis-trans isomerase D
MFNWVHTHKRAMQFILALVFLPFAFFGVDSYFRESGLGAEVARVGDYKVTQQEFQRAVQERQETMRRMLNNSPIDPEILDSPEVRFAALEQIIRDRLFLSQAIRSGLVVSDAQLRDVITRQESFHEGGKFSRERYEGFLRSQNLSSLGFEARLRRDLLQQTVMDAFAQSGFIPNAVAERIVRLSEQTREVSVASVSPAAFASQVTIDDSEIRAYYDARVRDFEVPEQIRLEYVVLSLDNLAAQTEVTVEEVRQIYDQNPARFARSEEREASHILMLVASGASADAKIAAKARAEDLLKQLREKPERFAELAREHSQDPGSAQSGGDLGFLVRGATDKAFDDALFGMKVGEIVGPVETEFGYHLIRLKSIRGGSTRSFDEVRGSIESELKRSRASKRYAEQAEQLSNMAYEQSDSLKPAADALKLTIQQSPWVTRKPVQGSPLGGEKFLKAVFSEDVIKNRRNSEVVEIAQGTLIAARLLEHKPAARRLFDDVKAEIRKRLIDAGAHKLALADGRAKLEKLRKGEDAGVSWGKPVEVSRMKPEGLSEPVLREVFRVDAAKIPAYAGTDDPSAGYQLIRISRVTEPREINPDARKAVAEQLRRLIGQEQLANYVAAMKRRVDVKIGPDVIEKK